MNNTQSTVALRILIQNLSRFVPRAIIYDDKFKLHPLLRQDAIEGRSKVRSTIVDAHYHRYFGISVHALRRSKPQVRLPIARHPTSRAPAPYRTKSMPRLRWLPEACRASPNNIRAS